MSRRPGPELFSRVVTRRRVTQGLTGAKCHPEVNSSGLGKALEFRDVAVIGDFRREIWGKLDMGHPHCREELWLVTPGPGNVSPLLPAEPLMAS